MISLSLVNRSALENVKFVSVSPMLHEKGSTVLFYLVLKFQTLAFCLIITLLLILFNCIFKKF